MYLGIFLQRGYTKVYSWSVKGLVITISNFRKTKFWNKKVIWPRLPCDSLHTTTNIYTLFEDPRRLFWFGPRSFHPSFSSAPAQYGPDHFNPISLQPFIISTPLHFSPFQINPRSFQPQFNSTLYHINLTNVC